MLRSSILYFLIIVTITRTKIVQILVFGEVLSTESSAEYLYNVMNQLQEHNRPSPASVDRTTDSGNDFKYYNSNKWLQQKDILQNDATSISVHRENIDNYKQKPLIDHSNTKNDQQFSDSVSHYQVQSPQTILKPVQITKEPPPLGLTRNDLALLYKTALHQGSPVLLSSLKSPLNSGQVSQVSGNQLRLNSAQPGYYYYFYPLKEFMNELQDNHSYKMIQHDMGSGHSNVATESSGKQVANPLFMAISGFIGMALIFMASVLFLPRFENLGSRNSSEEFSLTKVAWDAIEGRNCSQRFACELNRLAVKFEMSKRSRRILENIIPSNIRRQMIRIRKSTKKRKECRFITCKSKS